MTSEVRPQISSIILKRLFTEGSEVKEGQSLYEIDPCPYEAQLAQAEADKAKNEASLANAKLNLARDVALLSNELAVTQQQYDDQKALVAELVAAVAADMAAIETARLNLNYIRCSRRSAGRHRYRPSRRKSPLSATWAAARSSAVRRGIRSRKTRGPRDMVTLTANIKQVRHGCCCDCSRGGCRPDRAAPGVGALSPWGRVPYYRCSSSVAALGPGDGSAPTLTRGF
jgi:multidrug efflux pump subunit AcrA (membrane-fusion protein)